MDENLLKIQELESRVESLHEKLGEAKIVLKMIAKYEPKKTWVETSYNNGSYKSCEQCVKMIELAKSGLEELESEKKSEPWNG